MSSLSPIRQLLALITQSVETLEKTCVKNGTGVPDLYEPFSPPSEAFRADPVAAEAANIISAAALHMEAILTPPQVSLYRMVGGHFKSTTIRACLESNVTKILREAGPQGLHVEDIASQNGQDPKKLGRFLRYLANHHVYRELQPNVFTNTRISSMLDTLKPSKVILANPERKHDNTMGLAALASHHLDEVFKASAYSWETLADSQTVLSEDPSAAPLGRVMKTTDTLWQFYARPEENFRQRRFGIGMKGVQAMQPADTILTAFDWKSLAPESVVVDVGGGIGSVSLPLAAQFPHLKIVVQDLPSVIEDAKAMWSTEMPDAIKSGQVKLEAHDFFTPQPQANASVFFLKQICHDWSDQYCMEFLKQLRSAATPKTVLFLMESIMPFACHDPSSDSDNGIPGATPKEAPAPLLANYGAVNEMGYNADITMFLLTNSQERTILHIDELLRNTGWKVTVVRRRPEDNTFLQSIEAVPI
ncbi:S-adenosyl-L-methionine-dependent methyltransferase [Collybia nuda]|uniref:S-adenosyl-L-methionine-dependent methyltransferase n=1 Tax=Collybia nuda TaxID=64659 RepID=A0A9P6CE03_9AGAR|nr:S-adenosyl-L-methionine-dependent methyltransferase [Collybia nuda]